MTTPYRDLAKGQDLHNLIKALRSLNQELSEIRFATIPEPLTYEWCSQNTAWENLFREVKMYGDSVLFDNPHIDWRAYTTIINTFGFTVRPHASDKEALLIEAPHFNFKCGPHLGYYD